MPLLEKAELALERLRVYSAQKAQCFITATATEEFVGENNALAVLRSVQNNELKLLAIAEGRGSILSTNRISSEEIDALALRTVETAKASASDLAFDIAPGSERGHFAGGELSPNFDAMYMRMEGLLSSAQAYTGLRIWIASLEFMRETALMVNSNGAYLHSETGLYKLMIACVPRSADKVGSFNTVELHVRDMSSPLLSCGPLERFFSNTPLFLNAHPVAGKFVGDLLIAPECLVDFVGYLCSIYLHDKMIMAGTSAYAGKIGSVISSPLFSLISCPNHEALARKYYITPDGYAAHDLTLVENGVLKAFLLSRYGAVKSGNRYVPNAGGCFIVPSGPQSYDELVAGVERGILLGRFSGGVPNENGDFSGLAKNSFYVENGKIKHPVSETMVSGNIHQMLLNINGISRERVNLGNAIYPWVSIKGVAISGK